MHEDYATAPLNRGDPSLMVDVGLRSGGAPVDGAVSRRKASSMSKNKGKKKDKKKSKKDKKKKGKKKKK